MFTKDLLQQYQDELKEIQDEYEAFNTKRDLQLPVVQENLKNARLRAARASETFNELVELEDAKWVNFYNGSSISSSGKLYAGSELSLSGLHRILEEVGVPEDYRVKFMENKKNQVLVKEAARMVFMHRHENNPQIHAAEEALKKARVELKAARDHEIELRNELGLHWALKDAERHLSEHMKRLEVTQSLAKQNLAEVPVKQRNMYEKALENLSKLATSEVAAANFRRTGEKTGG